MKQQLLLILSIYLPLFLISCADESKIYQIINDNSSVGRVITIASRFEPDIRCEYGGISVKAGIDKNKNGLLEDDEIADIKFICNEEDPVEPPVELQLITAEQEPVGENCKQGGVVVKIGFDMNKNKILDAEEVKSTHYICNGETPEPPLPPETEEKFGKMLVYQNPAKPSNICNIDNITIYNTGIAPLIVTIETNENTSFVNRKEYKADGAMPAIPPMLPPLPQPFYIVPNGYKDISFNMQPISQGVVPVGYRLVSNNPDDEIFIRSDNCTVVSAAGKTFDDIISDDYIFITSEYNKIQSIFDTRVCKTGSDCYIGLPQGVAIGTYPVAIKVDWGNGISEKTEVTKITSADSYLFKHIYDSPGNYDIQIWIKTADMINFEAKTFSIEVN